MNSRNFFGLIGAIVISQLAGIVGSLFTGQAINTWYATLEKPALQPPAWLFGPVWTILYVLMGVAAFLVWRNGWAHRKAKVALMFFFVQLVLNALWSIIFFGLHSPGGALVEMAFLWVAIVATIVAFARVSAIASWLLAPYLIWVSFAAYLNYAIWILN